MQGKFDDEFPLMMEREMNGFDMASLHAHVQGHSPVAAPPVAVAFGNHYEVDAVKSAEAGHDVYRDIVYIKICIPGDRNNIYFQPAKDRDKLRFPEAWKAFQERCAGRETRQGMLIDHWAAINKSVALTLKAAHIYTVEALAEVHDGLIDRLGIDGRGLRERAKAFLAQAKDTAAATRLAAEKAALQAQIEALQAQISALAAQGIAPQPAPEVGAARSKRAKN